MLLALWPAVLPLFQTKAPEVKVAPEPRAKMPAKEVIPRRLVGYNKLRDDDALLILLM